MKPIKDSKSVGTRTFVHILVVMLLLSSMIGTTVCAEKPGKPDNPRPPSQTPPPEPQEFEFYISIGEDGSDVFLTSGSLVVEGLVPTSGWYWSPEKNTKSGSFCLEQNRFRDSVPNCGIFDVNLVYPPDLPALITADSFTISHQWVSRIRIADSKPSKAIPIDIWDFYITWGWSETDPEDYSNLRMFRVYTDLNAEQEGTYHPETADTPDWWEIDFNGASWELLAFSEECYGYLLAGGTIEDGFTVAIMKGPEIQ